MLEKIRIWLIYKLGGFTSFPSASEHKVVTAHCPIIKLRTQISITKDDNYLSNEDLAQEAARQFAESIMQQGLYKYEVHNDTSNSNIQIYNYTIYVADIRNS